MCVLVRCEYPENGYRTCRLRCEVQRRDEARAKAGPTRATIEADLSPGMPNEKPKTEDEPK